MALALVIGEVHRHKHSLCARALPVKGEEAVPRPVAFPGRRALKQSPLAVSDNRLLEQFEQSAIKLLELFIDRFFGSSNQVRRDPLHAAFELTLVEETKAG